MAPYLKLISILYSTSIENLVLLSQSERFYQNLLLNRSTNMMLPKYIAQLMLHKAVRFTPKRLGIKLHILLLNYYIAQGDSNEKLYWLQRKPGDQSTIK